MTVEEKVSQGRKHDVGDEGERKKSGEIFRWINSAFCRFQNWMDEEKVQFLEPFTFFLPPERG